LSCCGVNVGREQLSTRLQQRRDPREEGRGARVRLNVLRYQYRRCCIERNVAFELVEIGLFQADALPKCPFVYSSGAHVEHGSCGLDSDQRCRRKRFREPHQFLTGATADHQDAGIFWNALQRRATESIEPLTPGNGRFSPSFVVGGPFLAVDRSIEVHSGIVALALSSVRERCAESVTTCTRTDSMPANRVINRT